MITASEIRNSLKTSPDLATEAIKQFKSAVKNEPVPLIEIPAYFEVLVACFAIEHELALHSMAFRALCYLTRRVLLLDATALTAPAPLFLPVLIDHCSSEKTAHETAVRTFEDVWLAAPDAAEEALLTYGLTHARPDIREVCIKLLSDHITLMGGHFSFKKFTPLICHLIIDQSPSVRNSAFALLVSFFSTAHSAACESLRCELARQGVPHVVTQNLFVKIGGKSTDVTSQKSRHANPIQAKKISSTPSVSRAASVSSAPDIVVNITTNPLYPPQSLNSEDVYSVDSFRSMVEDFALPFIGKETDSNWQSREQIINRLRRILRGNLFDYPADFVWALKKLVDGINKAIQSLRTTLANSAMHLIKESAQLLCSYFDPVIDSFLTALVKVSCGSKKITANLAHITICSLVLNTSYSSKYLVQINTVMNSSIAQARVFAIQWLRILLVIHNNKIRNILQTTGGDLITEKIVVIGLNDANPSVRETSRSVFWLFASIWPDRGELIAETLETATKKALLRTQPTELFEVADSQIATAKPITERLVMPDKTKANTKTDFVPASSIPDIYRRVSKVLTERGDSTTYIGQPISATVNFNNTSSPLESVSKVSSSVPELVATVKAVTHLVNKANVPNDDQDSTPVDSNLSMRSDPSVPIEDESNNKDNAALNPDDSEKVESNGSGETITTEAPEIETSSVDVNVQIALKDVNIRTDDIGKENISPADKVVVTKAAPSNRDTTEIGIDTVLDRKSDSNQDDQISKDAKDAIASAASMVEAAVREAADKKSGKLANSQEQNSTGNGKTEESTAEPHEAIQASTEANSNVTSKNDESGGAIDEAVKEVSKKYNIDENKATSKLSSLADLLSSDDLGTMRDGIGILAFVLQGKAPPQEMLVGVDSLDLPDNDLVGKAIGYLFDKATDRVPEIKELLIKFAGPELVSTTIQYVGHAIVLWIAVQLLPADILLLTFDVIQPMLDIGNVVDTLFEIITSDNISDGAMLSIGQILLRIDKVPMDPALRVKAKAALEVIYRFGDLAQDVMTFLSDWIGFDSDNEKGSDDEEESDEEKLAAKNQLKFERRHIMKTTSSEARALHHAGMLQAATESTFKYGGDISADIETSIEEATTPTLAVASSNIEELHAPSYGTNQETGNQKEDGIDEDDDETIYSDAVVSLHPVSVSYKPVAGVTKSARKLKIPIRPLPAFSQESKDEISPFGMIGFKSNDILALLPDNDKDSLQLFESLSQDLKKQNITKEGMIKLIEIVKGSAVLLKHEESSQEMNEPLIAQTLVLAPKTRIFACWNKAPKFEAQVENDILDFAATARGLDELLFALSLLLIYELLGKGAYINDIEHIKVMNTLINVSGRKIAQSTSRSALPLTRDRLLELKSLDAPALLRALISTFDEELNREAQIFVLRTIRKLLATKVPSPDGLDLVIRTAITSSDIYVRKEAYPVLLAIHRQSKESSDAIKLQLTQGQRNLFDYYVEQENS